MRRCSLVAVGDEILDGRVPDTNSDLLSRELMDLGLEVVLRAVVGDDMEDICSVLSCALAVSDLVVVTGGLGPTEDDLTREAAAYALGIPLVRDEDAERALRSFFSRLGRKMSPSNARQADLLQGAERITPRLGTAPGQWLERDGKVLVLLPGVPREMEDMMRGDVLPRLREMLPQAPGRKTASMLVAARPESEVGEAVSSALREMEGLKVSYRALGGQIEVRITSSSEKELAEARARVKEELGAWVVAEDGETLEENLGRELRGRGLTLAVGESCTGGMVSERITRVPGSSDYFRGGVVAYDYRAKEELLGVPPSLLEERGAVDEEVAKAMARGARERFHAHLGLSVTGLAGPGSGGEKVEVGTVVFGLADASGSRAARYRLPGDREMVRVYASTLALAILHFHLRERGGGVGR